MNVFILMLLGLALMIIYIGTPLYSEIIGPKINKNRKTQLANDYNELRRYYRAYKKVIKNSNGNESASSIRQMLNRELIRDRERVIEAEWQRAKRGV